MFSFLLIKRDQRRSAGSNSCCKTAFLVLLVFLQPPGQRLLWTLGSFQSASRRLLINIHWKHKPQDKAEKQDRTKQKKQLPKKKQKKTSQIFHKHKGETRGVLASSNPPPPYCSPFRSGNRRTRRRRREQTLCSHCAAGNSSTFSGCRAKLLPSPSQVAACLQWQPAECQGKQATAKTRRNKKTKHPASINSLQIRFFFFFFKV